MNSAHLSIDVHCSWELKKKKFILFQLLIKKMPLSLSLIHSHLISLNLTLLTPVSLLTSLSQCCAPAGGTWLCSGLVDRSGFPHLHSAAGSWLCSDVRWYRGWDRCVVSTFSAFALLDFRGHGGDGGGGGSFCWWSDLWFVVVGLFCGVLLTLVVLCFVVLWVFFFFFLLWTGGGCGCGWW